MTPFQNAQHSQYGFSRVEEELSAVDTPRGCICSDTLMLLHLPTTHGHHWEPECPPLGSGLCHIPLWNIKSIMSTLQSPGWNQESTLRVQKVMRNLQCFLHRSAVRQRNKRQPQQRLSFLPDCDQQQDQCWPLRRWCTTPRWGPATVAMSVDLRKKTRPEPTSKFHLYLFSSF